MAVEFGPTVDHDAAAHQEHVAQPRSRPVPEHDLQREWGQHDVEILPVEQGEGFLFSWMTYMMDKEEELNTSEGRESSSFIIDEWHT